MFVLKVSGCSLTHTSGLLLSYIISPSPSVLADRDNRKFASSCVSDAKKGETLAAAACLGQSLNPRLHQLIPSKIKGHISSFCDFILCLDRTKQ